MSETQLTSRQRYFLNIIAQNEGLSREEIGKLGSVDFPISKLTLIRDLNLLVSLGFIKTTGQNRATRYKSAYSHPLLKYLDMSSYFTSDPDKRTDTSIGFDYGIFPKLPDIFSKEEIKEINCRSFTHATTKLDPTIVKRELERFVIELSWKSSKIEGNTYSLLETETLIKDGRNAVGKSQQETTMILNHKKTFETILKNRRDFTIISISNITQLHNLLTKGLEITSGIRVHAVGVTGTNYRPPDNQWQIKDALQNTIVAINSTDYPLEKALLAIALISYLQPFSDGNKRTGRMLANAILLAFDCFPLSYRSVSEDEYKKALIIFYEKGTLYHIKQLLVEQFKFANTTYFQ